MADLEYTHETIDPLAALEALLQRMREDTTVEPLWRKSKSDDADALAAALVPLRQQREAQRKEIDVAALPTIGKLAPDYPTEPTTGQKQRYALRQCFLLAIRMARKAQKADDSRSSEWNHIIRFCKDADEDG